MSGGWWATVNSGWFGLTVGTVLGVISIWIGYILYRKGRQFTNLRYSSRDRQLIGGASASNDGLEIRYDGHVVNRVVSTVAGVWNAGTDTILGSSIVDSDKLRFDVEGDGRVFRASVLKTQRAVNQACVSISGEKTVFIDFDYLDSGDGFTVEIIHSSNVGDMKLAGTIRGIPKGIELYERGKTFETVFLGVLVAMMVVGSLLFVSMIGAAVWFAISAPWPRNVITMAFVLGAVGIMALACYEGNAKKKVPTVKGIPEAVTSETRLFGL